MGDQGKYVFSVYRWKPEKEMLNIWNTFEPRSESLPSPHSVLDASACALLPGGAVVRGPWQGFHHKITPSWLFFRSTRAKSLVSVAVGIVCQAYEYRPVSTWHTEKHRVVLTKWMNNHLCWIMMAADFAGMQHVVNQVDGKHLWGGAVCEGRWTGSPFSLINRMLSATHSVPASGG